MLNNTNHKPKNRFLRVISVVAIVTSILSLSILYTYNVNKNITEEDLIYIDKILAEADTDIKNLGEANTLSFAEQIADIRTVQKSAFITAPKVSLIPKNTPREPKDLYNTNAAYCGDRARYIEKALRHLGYETRYASLYLNRDDQNFLSTMLTKTSFDRADSHALVEVKTRKGWMIVDTRKHWISLTDAQQVVSLDDLKDTPLSAFTWDTNNKEESWPLLDKNYYILYGLYSRHGQFYAPYTKFIPDINWPGFIKNNLKQLF